ncbi:hypothetical protein AVEN_110926-1 [Araneus ventricosus]|uniref:Uncharacterized protein n=1 Tax=Araneus ventricosus TaxID=182803 RepID=A0A4Y2UIJ0_ARAVE|nr:hypothetical protein AVEN_110926-1 [Araneus ventricosus]
MPCSRIKFVTIHDFFRERKRSSISAVFPSPRCCFSGLNDRPLGLKSGWSVQPRSLAPKRFSYIFDDEMTTTFSYEVPLWTVYWQPKASLCSWNYADKTMDKCINIGGDMLKK